jgi:hypothetical protein
MFKSMYINKYVHIGDIKHQSSLIAKLLSKGPVYIHV